MKRNISHRTIIAVFLMMVFVFSISVIYAEGLLPSLSDTVGIGMPSYGEALQCYPDSETENEDGSTTELYTNVTEADFNTFSIYLKEHEAELSDYLVQGSLLTAEIQVKGTSFQLSYDNRTGELISTYPAGTFDEWTKSAKTHVAAAQKLLDEGKAEEAVSEIMAIPNYQSYGPANDLLQTDDNLIAAAAAREAKLKPYRTVGNVVTFGHYEQDSNAGNGAEEIEWIVLDVQDGKALLISKYGLDAKPYNDEWKDVTWETCTLRTWLNGDFLQSAFSTEEKSAILTTAVDNSSSQGYSRWSTSGGNNTQDHIFLLSYAEANKYFNVTYDNSNNTESRAVPTAYAVKNGAWTISSIKTAEGDAAGVWWLRSPGDGQDYASCVYYDGSLHTSHVLPDDGCVRPAFWLNLESDIF